MNEIDEITELIIKKLSTKSISPKVRDLAKEIGISQSILVEKLAILQNHRIAEFHHTPMKNTVVKLENFGKVIQAGSLAKYFGINHLNLNFKQKSLLVLQKLKEKPERSGELTNILSELNINYNLRDIADYDKFFTHNNYARTTLYKGGCFVELSNFGLDYLSETESLSPRANAIENPKRQNDQPKKSPRTNEKESIWNKPPARIWQIIAIIVSILFGAIAILISKKIL